MFKLGSSILALAAALVSTGACAMSDSHQGAQASCRVISGHKFVTAAGGAAAICEAIEKAFAARVPNMSYTAEVRVLSKSAVAADVVVNGRKLPEQNMSVSDRDLSASSIERFARSLAEETAKASKS